MLVHFSNGVSTSRLIASFATAILCILRKANDKSKKCSVLSDFLCAEARYRIRSIAVSGAVFVCHTMLPVLLLLLDYLPFTYIYDSMMRKTCIRLHRFATKRKVHSAIKNQKGFEYI